MILIEALKAALAAHDIEHLGCECEWPHVVATMFGLEWTPPGVVPADMAQTPAACRCCGERWSAETAGQWRWNGQALEHRCEGVPAQAGHVAAEPAPQAAAVRSPAYCPTFESCGHVPGGDDCTECRLAALTAEVARLTRERERDAARAEVARFAALASGGK